MYMKNSKINAISMANLKELNKNINMSFKYKENKEFPN